MTLCNWQGYLSHEHTALVIQWKQLPWVQLPVQTQWWTAFKFFKVNTYVDLSNTCCWWCCACCCIVLLTWCIHYFMSRHDHDKIAPCGKIKVFLIWIWIWFVFMCTATFWPLCTLKIPYPPFDKKSKMEVVQCNTRIQQRASTVVHYS